MLKTILFSAAVLSGLVATGQSRKAIELSLIGRYDRHADYASNFGGRAYNDTNKLYGLSYGASLAYRQPVSKSISVAAGIGYYRLSIDKIKGSMPFNSPGTRTGRNIDYDDGTTNLLYSTSKYHYNNLSITVDLNKSVPLTDRLILDFGAEGIVYVALSQHYRLFEGPGFYHTTNSKPWECGANLTLGILKAYKRFYFRPALLVPVFQNLKGDKVFFEDRNMNISKWFNGIGLTFRAGIYM
jgi:hypothetical protein